MVSIIPNGGRFDYQPSMTSSYLQGPHEPRGSTSKSVIHSRSQSLPEAVYWAQQQQQLIKQQQNVMVRKSKLPGPHVQPQPVIVGLRRSQTYVGDMVKIIRRPSIGYYEGKPRQMPAVRKFDDANLMFYPARSRSNIAAMGMISTNLEHAGFYNAKPPGTRSRIGRAASFYHPSSVSATSILSRSSLALSRYRDVSQPLHVDCSVEYDLGNQPKIPKGSAPLLIIHPGYQQERFHPYSNIQMLSELDNNKSSGQGTSLDSFSLSSGSASPTSRTSRTRPTSEGFAMEPTNQLHISMPDIKVPSGLKGVKYRCRRESTVNLSRTESVDRLRLSMPNIGNGAMTHNSKAQHMHLASASVRKSPDSKMLSTRRISPDSDVISARHSQNCDSGLGTPSSLMVTEHNVSSSSQSGSQLNKWKSNMSGLVTGIFCCSSGAHSLQPEVEPEKRNVKKWSEADNENWPRQQNGSFFAYAPSTPEEASSPSLSSLWDDPRRVVTSSPIVQTRWMTSPTYSSTSTLSTTFGPRHFRRDFVAVCKFCRTTNPGDDCRDGFCSSVWNKENLMRPVHI